MTKPTTFDIEKAFVEETDVLDLHYAVLEAVIDFLEQSHGSDSLKLTAALRVSFNLVCQRYYQTAE